MKREAGTKLSLTVSDEAGNQSEPALITVGKNVTAPLKLVVHSISDQDTYVTGYSEKGAYIEVSINGSIVSESDANDADGSFSVYLGNSRSAGTQLTVTATDRSGNKSEAAVVGVKDATKPGKPEVSGITERTKEITGTAEAGAFITVYIGS